MSFEALQAAADLEGLTPGAHLVLLILARHACEACGAAWPGVAHIGRKAPLSERRVQGALAELEAASLIAAVGYRTGGRGRSTIYQVKATLEGVRLSTSPCANCGERLKTPQTLRGNGA